MTPGPPPQPGQPQPGPPPNPALQQAQAQLQQIQKQLEQIQENKQVLQLLRDEKTRGYRVEIETDSTIEPDEQAEKKSRIEFTEISGKFLGEALPILQLMPQAAPMFEQVFMFLVRGFRAGRELEDTIEQTMAAIGQAAQQPKPDPEQQKVEAQLKQGSEQHQQTMQQSAQQHQQKMEQDAQQGQLKMALEQEKAQQSREEHAATMQATERQAQMAEEQHGRDIEAKHEDRQSKRDEMELKFQGMDREQQRADDGHAKEMERAEQDDQQEDGNQADELKKVLSKALEAIADSNKQLAKAITAPRSLVRGEDGRAVGSKAEMN